MKKSRFLCLLLALLILSSCSSPAVVTETHENTEETASATGGGSSLPRISGNVSVGGLARAGEEVTPALSARVRDEGLSFAWLLDGAFVSNDRDFRLPKDAGGRQLVLEVTQEGKDGKLVSEAVTVEGKAPDVFYAMADLLPKVKWFGRSVTKDGAVTCDWSASGFEINVETQGEAFQVEYETEYPVYFVIHVDGEEVLRARCENSGSLYVSLTAGKHTLRVLKETSVNTSGKRTYLKNVGFDGTILDRTPDKDLYIEIIGDSFACGDCSLDKFEQGRPSTTEHNSATHSFAYVVANELDADYSVVSKGGIGLLKPSGPYTMPEIYEYVNGYADRETKYDFTRRIPDIILLEMGTNDYSYTDAQYLSALMSFIDTLRAKYGKTPAIVWTGKKPNHEVQMNAYIASKKASDSRLYSFRFPLGTNGGAATATSTSGHPDVADHLAYGQAIVEYLRSQGLV